MMSFPHTIVLAAVTWTARFLYRQGRRPTEKRVVLGVAAGLVVGCAGMAAGTTTCGGPMPIVEWAVPAACLMAVLLFAPPSFAGRVACGAFVIAALVLPFHAAMPPGGRAGLTVTAFPRRPYASLSCR